MAGGRDVIVAWLDRLGLGDQLPVHVLMGGLSTDDRAWRMWPGNEAILVGTQDMVLSRLLLRGYAEPRAAWPVAFGVLHASTQFVFDEVQLMGPAVPTSLQLEGLRQILGTAAACRSMWMSATVDTEALRTVDYPGPRTVVSLGGDDRSGPLRRRLAATRTVTRGEAHGDTRRHARSVADLVRDRHQARTRTIVIANTVDRAVAIFDALAEAGPNADLLLLHSRYRPADRRRLARAATAEPGPAGMIVVSTQVLEAGVDLTSRLLVTEVAPWSSIVQRAGRCNRAGEYDEAAFVWLFPPAGRELSAPYNAGDLDRSAEALTALEGTRVTGTDLQDRAVLEQPPLHPVLRRRDLLDLLDTAPDLSGNDLDVGRWIREPDTTTAAVAWRAWTTEGPAVADRFPSREEICPVPLDSLRDAVGEAGRRASLYDERLDIWRPARREDIRPGAVIVLNSEQGGYLPNRGWSPQSAVVVDPVDDSTAEQVNTVGGDPFSVQRGRWVPLAEHLDDVKQEVQDVLTECGDLPGLAPQQREAAVIAGLYHDLGKAHPIFAETLRRTAVDEAMPPSPGPWAKSPGGRRVRHSRRHFRHELASALMLLHPDGGLLEGVPEAELVTYLVAAHHGKVRLSVRALPGEQSDRVLGVAEDDPVPAFVLPGGRQVPALGLRLDRLSVGSHDASDSWQASACRLRDRPDLGPFRLAFLEAVVRMADWRASARYDIATEVMA